jgi:hypothetical protein
MQREIYKDNVFSDWRHISIHLMELDEIAFVYPTLTLVWLLEHYFSNLIFSKFDPCRVYLMFSSFTSFYKWFVSLQFTFFNVGMTFVEGIYLILEYAETHIK